MGFWRQMPQCIRCNWVCAKDFAKPGNQVSRIGFLLSRSMHESLPRRDLCVGYHGGSQRSFWPPGLEVLREELAVMLDLEREGLVGFLWDVGERMFPAEGKEIHFLPFSKKWSFLFWEYLQTKRFSFKKVMKFLFSSWKCNMLNITSKANAE